MSQASHPQLPNSAAGDDQVVGHVSARMKRERPPAKMTLNLTSMIDVIFQLLIYFVVTASFTIDEGVITTKLPQEGSASRTTEREPPQTPLNIMLASSGQFQYRMEVEGAPEVRDFVQLQRHLASLRTDVGGFYDPEKKPIIIKPDGEVRWQHVVNAFNAALGARYSNVSFAQAR